MRETRVLTDGLRSAIERSGYYPGLVSDAVASALGSEPVTAYVVHHDAIFDPGMEVRRHMTVLALTPTRLVYSHTDEHPAEDSDSRPRAETSTEAIRFGKISSVALSRVVPGFNYDVPASGRSIDAMKAFVKQTGAQVWVNHDKEQHLLIPKAPLFVD